LVAVSLVKIKLRLHNADPSRWVVLAVSARFPRKSIFRVLIQRAKPEKCQNVAVCMEINTSSPLSPVGTSPIIPNPPLAGEAAPPIGAWAGWGVHTRGQNPHANPHKNVEKWLLIGAKSPFIARAAKPDKKRWRGRRREPLVELRGARGLVLPLGAEWVKPVGRSLVRSKPPQQWSRRSVLALSSAPIWAGRASGARRTGAPERPTGRPGPQPRLSGGPWQRGVRPPSRARTRPNLHARRSCIDFGARVQSHTRPCARSNRGVSCWLPACLLPASLALQIHKDLGAHCTRDGGGNVILCTKEASVWKCAH